MKHWQVLTAAAKEVTGCCSSSSSFIGTGWRFSIKTATKNSTEKFPRCKRCFRFSANWLWQDFHETLLPNVVQQGLTPVKPPLIGSFKLLLCGYTRRTKVSLVNFECNGRFFKSPSKFGLSCSELFLCPLYQMGMWNKSTRFRKKHLPCESDSYNPVSILLARSQRRLLWVTHTEKEEACCRPTFSSCTLQK